MGRITTTVDAILMVRCAARFVTAVENATCAQAVANAVMKTVSLAQMKLWIAHFAVEQVVVRIVMAKAPSDGVLQSG